MLQNIDLRELSELRGNGRDVVSAYFSGEHGLSQLASRERHLRDLLEDDEMEAENFERSMQRIRDLLADHSVRKAEGVCFFSSEVLDFARGYPISMPVPNRLIVGPAPFIRPLAELQDEYETFAMVVCSNDRTRIHLVTNEVTEVEAAIKGGIKNHVRKGGWSQQRYERRRDEQLSRYGEDVSNELQQIVKDYDINRIVLLGSDESIRAIEEELPEQIAEKIVAREPFDLDRSKDEMLEAAYESYFEDERESEIDLWERIKNYSMSDGRAVTGAEPTLQAAKIGRVEAAIVTRDAKQKGTRCPACDDVFATQVDQCPECQSTDVFPVDLIDAIARYLELTSARIDFSDPIKGLTKCGDVAALLRY